MTPELDRYRRDLLAVWDRTEDLHSKDGVSNEEIIALSGAMKDVLLGLGMRYSAVKEAYVFEQEEQESYKPS